MGKRVVSSAMIVQLEDDWATKPRSRKNVRRQDAKTERAELKAVLKEFENR